MLLTQGTLASIRGRLLGGTGSGHGLQATSRLGFNPWLGLNKSYALDDKSSYPDGYRGGVAISMAKSDGGMACRILDNLGSFISDITATGNLESDTTGEGNVTNSNLAGGINISVTVNGDGTITVADMRGKARVSCTISIGAQPTAEDIAQAVWNFAVAGNTAPGNTAEYLKKTLKRDEFLGLD